MPPRDRAAERAREQEDLLNTLLAERDGLLCVLDRVLALRGAAHLIRDAAGADAGFDADLAGPGRAVIRWLAGNRTQALQDLVVPESQGIGGRVLALGTPVRVRDGVALLLRGEPSLVVVGSAESGWVALDRAPALRPDLVLLDLRLPDMLAPEVVTGLRELCPAARVVVFTAHGDHRGVQAALDAEAHGALLKDAATTDLVAALRRVLHGERVSDPRIVPGVPGNPAALAGSGLTRREYEVLRLAAQGRTNPEIAESTGLAATPSRPICSGPAQARRPHPGRGDRPGQRGRAAVARGRRRTAMIVKRVRIRPGRDCCPLRPATCRARTGGCLSLRPVPR